MSAATSTAAPAIDTCIALARVQARQALAIDDALGRWHGLSLRELDLLRGLADAPAQTLPMKALASRLGLTTSDLLRLALPLAKTGLVERAPGTLTLRPGGARLAREAMDNAEAAAARTLAALPADERATLHRLLAALS